MIEKTIPDAICWQEGMRLTPQHFQQQSLRHERLSTYLLQVVQPYFWGLLALDAQVAGTRFEIRALEAIMPDGLFISYEAGQMDVLNIDLALQKADHNGEYSLFLAIKAHSSAVKQNREDRFRKISGMPIADANTGSGELALTILQPVLQLICGQLPGYEEYDLLPLARYRRQDSVFKPTSFIAPCPRVVDTSTLYVNIKRICNVLREKYIYLALQYANHHSGGESQRAAEVQWKLGFLGAPLLELEALLATNAHPYQLYLLMNSLLGALTAADPAQGCPFVKAFNYLDMSICMDDLMAQIDTRLQQFSPAYTCLTFAYDGQRSFAFNLAAIAPASQYHIGLRLQSGMTETDVVQWLNASVIASSNRIGLLERHRVAGIERIALSGEQAAEFESSFNMVVFKLNVTGDSRDYFDREDGNLTIVGSASVLLDHVMPKEIVLFQKRIPDIVVKER